MIKLRLQSKITSGYILVLVCLIFSLFILNVQMRDLQKERNKVVNEDTDIQALANELEKDILDMNRAQRGFVITGNEVYLEPYNKAIDKWQDEYNELYKLLDDQPEQQAKMADIYQRSQKWIDEIASKIIQDKRLGNQSEIDAIFNEEVGRRDMTGIQESFEQFRDVQTDYLTTEGAKLDKKNQNITIMLFGIVFIIAIIAGVVSSSISRSIVQTLKQITKTIESITTKDGSLKTRIRLTTEDEIKDLAVATNQLLDDLDNRNWLQKNAKKILEDYQGASSIEQLTTNFLRNVVVTVNGASGVFYTRSNVESNILRKTAQFALENNTDVKDVVKTGEGLVGECALYQKQLVFNDVDETNIRIQTVSGVVAPKALMYMPVLVDGVTVGVMGIAKLTNFTQLEQQLINTVVQTYGLTMQNVLAQMENARLLTESQALSEELQVQSEELQSQSEELQSQSEELQMQTEALTKTNVKLAERTKEVELNYTELEKVKEQLETSAEELMRSSKYKSQFLANMSHELRTPLNSILILSEMLLENERLLAEDKEFAKVIHTSGKDLLALINDILDLSKVEAGKMELAFEEICLRELPLYLKQSFSHFNQEKQLHFDITLADDAPEKVYSDLQRIQQILKNLLSNAFKFTDDGSIHVAIKRYAQVHLSEVQRQLSENWIEISVEDTGIGIPKAQQQMVFESFQQVDGATARKYGGTGLGLSICKQFIQLLGGEISLVSEEGVGSTFTILIPSLQQGLPKQQPIKKSQVMIEKAQVTEVVQESASSQQKNDFEGKHILIVDDDYRNIYSLKNVLEQYDIRVSSARTGIECIEMMKKTTDVDLILMDIMMPEMDGYEAITVLRNQYLMTLPIVALTAKAMQQDRERCLEVGASDYLSKPLNLEQLVSVLRVWLTDKELSQA